MVFEDIYKTHWKRVFRLCMGYVNDADVAKDIAQETFIIVWQQLPKLRSDVALVSWILKIASNQCLRQIGKENKFPKTDLLPEIPEAPPPEIEDKVKFLYQCIAELKETDRLIISLELEDVNQSEIAEIMGLTPSNVRVRIHRIKELLTEKFRRYE
ncbi:RNA polymerase sigma factor [soil metagenome]